MHAVVYTTQQLVFGLNSGTTRLRVHTVQSHVPFRAVCHHTRQSCYAKLQLVLRAEIVMKCKCFALGQNNSTLQERDEAQ